MADLQVRIAGTNFRDTPLRLANTGPNGEEDLLVTLGQIFPICLLMFTADF